MRAREPEAGGRSRLAPDGGRRTGAPALPLQRLQRAIGNRATARLLAERRLQRLEDDDEEEIDVDPKTLAYYSWDPALHPRRLGDYLPPPLPQRATVSPPFQAVPQAVVVEQLPQPQHAVSIKPPPVPEVAPPKEGEKKKRRKKGKKPASPTTGPTEAPTPKPKVRTADIRIPGYEQGSLSGNELRSGGAAVATVSAEQLRNTAGERGADHEVPLDILADAASRAMKRWKNWKADEQAGGNYGYFFPVGSNSATNTFLCVVLNGAGILLTSYTTSRNEVARKLGLSGVALDRWASEKHLYPSWR